MFTKPKLLTAFCIMLVVLNAVALLVGILFVSTLNISFGIHLAIVAYFVTTTLVSVFLTVSIRDIIQQLNLDYESNARHFNELSKKITSLEQELAAK